MKFNYDKKADALAIRFSDKPYAESDEVSEGVIFDYNKQGQIIGLEILDASRKMPKELKQKFASKRLPVVLDLVG